MKKKTKAKKKPIGSPLEGPQNTSFVQTDFGPVEYKTYHVQWGGIPKTDSDRIADLEKKVEKLEESKADKPVYNKGDLRIKQAPEYSEYAYAVHRFDGHNWDYENCFDFQWTARRWIRKKYGTTANILPGVHHD